MKKGAPNIAVSIPTGISEGGLITLAIVSIHRRKIAPDTIVIGRSVLWLGPTIILIICGVMRPMNPIMPQTDTAVAVTMDDNNSIIFFDFCEFNPKFSACSSPRSNKSKSFVYVYNIIDAILIIGNAINT